MNDVSACSIIVSTPGILSLISSILLVMLVSIVSLFHPFSFLGLKQFNSISSPVLLHFPYFFKGFTHFLFKGLYHLHKTGFKDILLCFDCVRISRACYSRIPGLWICHIDLVLFDCVLMLAFSQLVIPGSFCHRRPEEGCLCLDIGNQVTVYVSRKLGRAVDVPAAAGLLNVGLIVAKDWHQGRTSLRSALDFTLFRGGVETRSH